MEAPLHWGRALGSIQDAVAEKLGPLEKAVQEAYKGLNEPDYNAPPTLGGNGEDDINAFAIGCLFALVVVTSLAACVDIFCGCVVMKDRPKVWAIALLMSSYLLLVPGLCSVLLSMSIVVNVIGHRINVHPDSEKDSCTESTPGLARLMYDTGSRSGALLIVLFAMVIPAVELVLLTLGEIFRNRRSTVCDRWIRAVILWVQHRSKWASPDMFAHILLVHLVRGLNHPDLVLADARLDIGFACFSYFCVCATVSSLGFPLPGSPDKQEGLEPPLALRMLGRWGIMLFTLVSATIFAVLLGIGFYAPIMSLRIHEQALYKPQGPLPLEAKKALDVLEVVDMLSSDVNLQSLLAALAGWAAGGEATSFIGFVMYAVFVVGLTAVDVLALLLIAAVELCSCRGLQGAIRGRLLAVSSVLRRLAMLDVSVVGVYLVACCMSIYEEIGVTVATRKGLFFLLGAEVAHSVVYYVVSGVAEHAEAQAGRYASAPGDELPERAQEGAGPPPCSDLAGFQDDVRIGCCTATKRLWPLVMPGTTFRTLVAKARSSRGSSPTCSTE